MQLRLFSPIAGACFKWISKSAHACHNPPEILIPENCRHALTNFCATGRHTCREWTESVVCSVCGPSSRILTYPKSRWWRSLRCCRKSAFGLWNQIYCTSDSGKLKKVQLVWIVRSRIIWFTFVTEIKLTKLKASAVETTFIFAFPCVDLHKPTEQNSIFHYI